MTSLLCRDTLRHGKYAYPGICLTQKQAKTSVNHCFPFYGFGTVTRDISSRRGGRNLSERFSHLPNLSHSQYSYVDVTVAKLSEPGLSNSGAQAAASRIAREHEEHTLLSGVKIPKKPTPPAEDECCMSGCAVCVYDLYLESKQSYRTALSAALDQVEEKGVRRDTWPKELLDLADRRAKISHGELSSDNAADGSDEATTPLDASLNAFLALEKKLKQTAATT